MLANRAAAAAATLPVYGQALCSLTAEADARNNFYHDIVFIIYDDTVFVLYGHIYDVLSKVYPHQFQLVDTHTCATCVHILHLIVYWHFIGLNL